MKVNFVNWMREYHPDLVPEFYTEMENADESWKRVVRLDPVNPYLYSAFDWDESTRGSDFWSDINDQFWVYFYEEQGKAR
jgi:hypothetical protein